MFRNLSLLACLFAFSFFAPVALAESVGCGNTCSSTSTQSVETDESTDDDTTLLEWFSGDTTQ